MKKIFILTGEPSGDKLASKVISKLQKNNPEIEYSCVGGTHLNSLGIKSIFELKEITYIGFTSVLLNIFKIRNKINKTVEEIIRFNPDVLFSVDSPDFTLRVDGWQSEVKGVPDAVDPVPRTARVWPFAAMDYSIMLDSGPDGSVVDAIRDEPWYDQDAEATDRWR